MAIDFDKADGVAVSRIDYTKSVSAYKLQRKIEKIIDWGGDNMGRVKSRLFGADNNLLEQIYFALVFFKLFFDKCDLTVNTKRVYKSRAHQVKPVLRIKDNKIVYRFNSVVEASEDSFVSRSRISHCMKHEMSIDGFSYCLESNYDKNKDYSAYKSTKRYLKNPIVVLLDNEVIGDCENAKEAGELIGTCASNIVRAARQGRSIKGHRVLLKSEYVIGGDYPLPKGKEPIPVYFDDGNRKKVFNSYRQASEKTNINRVRIMAYCKKNKNGGDIRTKEGYLFKIAV